jgi:hypothetical protein
MINVHDYLNGLNVLLLLAIIATVVFYILVRKDLNESRKYRKGK